MPPQSILTNAAIASAGRLVNALLGLVIVALLTRYLGPASFGQYSLLISLGAIIQLLADAGLYLTLSRELSRAPGAEIIAHIFSLRLALLLVSFLGGAAVVWMVPAWRPLIAPFLVLAVGFSGQSLSQLMMGVYQYYQAVWRATLGDIVGRFFQIAAIVALGAMAWSISGMALAFSTGALAALLLHRWLLPPIPLRLSFAWPAWRHLIALTWPLGAMLLINAIYFRLDIIVLSFFRPAAEVGFYGVAYRLVESSLFFPAMLGGLLLPRLSEAYSRSRLDLIARYVNEGVKIVLLLSSLFFIILLTEGDYFLTMLSGPHYLPAYPLLKVLSLAMVIMFVGQIFGFALVAFSKQKFLLSLYGGLAVFNLLANLIFIPYWGAIAAAWTTVATELISSLAAGIVLTRLFPFRPPLAYLSLLFAVAIAAIAATWLVSPYLSAPLQLLVIASLYALAVWRFNLIGRREFVLLRSIHAYGSADRH